MGGKNSNEKAGSAPSSDEEDFRTQLAAWHVELEKTLWAEREARGKAYELGNALSDTWNRVVRGLRPSAQGDSSPESRVTAELRAVFSEERKQRIRSCLTNSRRGSTRPPCESSSDT